MLFVHLKNYSNGCGGGGGLVKLRSLLKNVLGLSVGRCDRRERCVILFHDSWKAICSEKHDVVPGPLNQDFGRRPQNKNRNDRNARHTKVHEQGAKARTT